MLFDAESTDGRALFSRHCHSAARIAGRFPQDCGFPVIYFVSNIFFLRPSEARCARASTTPG
jgi:hypothetical protein